MKKLLTFFIFALSFIGYSAYALSVFVIPQGGTGWANIQTGAIPYGQGTAKLATTTQGTGGQVLAWSGGIPTWVSTSTLANGGPITVTYAAGTWTLGCATCNTSNATVSSIATNNGVTGGTITTTGTVGLAAIAANSVLANQTSASAVPAALATSSLFTGTVGQNAYFSGTGTLIGTSSLFISTASQVGIGTVAPTARLVVSNNSSAPTTTPTGTNSYFVNADGANTFLTMDAYGAFHSDFLFRQARGTAAAATASQADDVIGQLQARGYGASAFPVTARASLRLTAAENWTDAAQGTYVSFLTTPKLSTTQAEVMRIDSTGNVGISTTSPSSLLSVAGNGYFTGNVGVGHVPGVDFDIWKSSAGTGVSGVNFRLRNDGVGDAGFFFYTASGNQVWAMGEDASDSGKFKISNDGSAADVGVSTRLTVDASGNVGIGTTTPWRTLSVTGTVGFSSTLTTASALQSGDLCVNANYEMTNDSVLCVASALRFKKDIFSLSGGLDELMKFRPVSFYWKPEYNGNLQTNPNYSGQQVGLVADELGKIDPRLITVEIATSTDGPIKSYPGMPHGLNLEAIAGVTVQAIQDLNAKVERQQKEIDELKALLKK